MTQKYYAIKYYAIYDINHRKYFTDNPFCASKLANSALDAKWFCSRLAARIFIKQHKELQHKSAFCVRTVADFS